MDLDLSEEQILLRDSVRRYLAQEYGFDSRHRSHQPILDQSRWKAFADLGWLGAALPEAYGGLGGTITDAALIQEELGRGLVQEPVLALAVLGPQALLATGAHEPCQALLPRVAAGEMKLSLAHEEAAARFSPQFVGTTAERTTSGYRLNGSKVVVVGAPVSDKLLVSARTGDDDIASQQGVSLFVVDPHAPGVEMTPYWTVDGLPAADLILRDVNVLATAMAGAPGGAYPAIEHALDYATVVACADALGAMDQALWTTRDYLKVRRQFGATLSSFQALQHRMADMFIEVEQSRSMVYRGISVFSQPDNIKRRRMVMAVKAFIAQAARFVGGQAIQLHGAIGMTDECSTSHLYRRLYAFSILMGHAEFCLAEFGRLDEQFLEEELERDELRIFA